MKWTPPGRLDGHDVIQVWARRSASDGHAETTHLRVLLAVGDVPHSVSEVAPQELPSLRAPRSGNRSQLRPRLSGLSEAVPAGLGQVAPLLGSTAAPLAAARLTGTTCFLQLPRLQVLLPKGSTGPTNVTASLSHPPAVAPRADQRPQWLKDACVGWSAPVVTRGQTT